MIFRRGRCRGGCRTYRCRRRGTRCWGCVRHERSLDLNTHRRSGLKETDVSSAAGWGRGRIESKIIKRAPPDSVGVLILRKSFAIPGRRKHTVSESPGSTAIALVILRSIISPARFLWRRVKSHIAQVRRKKWIKNFERLNRPIQVHVKNGILIMPQPA